jgi:formylglycine-generating enzyme required for sulfatase activity
MHRFSWLIFALVSVPLAAAAQSPAPGAVFRDCADCPEMIVVPAGSFRMGSPADRAMSESESPRHPVTFDSAFAVGRHEVTKVQYAAFIKDSGYAPAGKGCQILKHPELEWVADDSKDWRDPGFPAGDDHPVVCVNWDDAKAYVEWLGKKTGKAYRLLSEAEWEYAALAGSNNPRPGGDDEKNTCAHGNVWDETYEKERGLPTRREGGMANRAAGTGPTSRDRPGNPFETKKQSWYLEIHWCSDAYSYTAPAGKFLANKFGLHDMIGNAWEWVEDCLNFTYSGAPGDGSAWRGGNCDSRVLRGGSWSSAPLDTRAVQRIFRAKSVRRSDMGFRVARAP